MVYFAMFLRSMPYKPQRMKTIHQIKELQQELDVPRKNGKKIGFVPTMGALHEGHISLVGQSVAGNDITVVSIFVNPTQFNDPKDLEKYPRTLEADSKLLAKSGVDIVFVPAVEEMYPQVDTRTFSYPPLDTVMEGAFRPGHFNGVCQIVSKLFDAVGPDQAYFGEKDFQQLAIIREMVSRMAYDIEIIGCPIVREADGLALSSRNMRLSTEGRKNALGISAALKRSLSYAEAHSVEETAAYVETEIAASPGLMLEYFQIVDGKTLQPVNSWDDSPFIIGCIAAFCDGIRLIDNIKYKEDK